MPFLSIIIPAHNETSRLPAALEKLDTFIRAQTYETDVWVIENGSSDSTYEMGCDYARRLPWLHVLHEPARGKGLAVKRGMLESRGEYRFICDVDFSMPVEEINRFLPPQTNHPEVLIGSREAPGSCRYNEPPYRHFVGRVFNTIVRVLALPDLQDTQCGFKCFRGDIADQVFPLQTLGGWSFDVEVLFIARRMGYTVQEVGIPWYFNADSRIKVLNDSARMFFDLINVRLNALKGKYGPPRRRG